MQHSRIIDELSERLGSQSRLAAKLGFAVSTISHWRNDDGIPPRHWPAVLKLAKRLNWHRLTLDQIAAGPARPHRNDAKHAEAA